MPIFVTERGNVHYEVYGRGSPVILLHGWLGSWGLWQETMSTLGQSFRTYALDFWGFGESAKKSGGFTVSDFVFLIDQFMQRLGIDRAPLVGHSMGGTVSLSVAINFPDRVRKVVVVGSPITGSSLSLLLKLFSRPMIAAFVHNNLWALRYGFRVLSPYYTRDPRWPEMMNRDLSRTTLESFLLSIASLRDTDLRPLLPSIQTPVLGMYGDKDIVVDPRQWQALIKGIPHAQIERFPASGHFIMLDEPQPFTQSLHEFLSRDSVRNSPDPAVEQVRVRKEVSLTF